MSNIKFKLFFVFFSFCFLSKAQNTFKIIAHVEGVEQGSVQCVILPSSGYMGLMKDGKIKLVNGIFRFELQMTKTKEPLPIYFFIYNGEKPFMKTDVALFSPRNQKVVIKKDGSIVIEDNLMKHQKYAYDKYFRDYHSSYAHFTEKGRELVKPDKNQVEEMIDLRDKLALKKDSLLFDFSKTNKNSYFLLNDLSQNIYTYGYKEIYEKTFDNLSPIIKKSQWAKNVREELMVSKNFQYGKVFTVYKIGNDDLRKWYGKKLTLVDFWFSYCSPCIAEMSFYSDVYTRYKEEGFEIISISTDRSQDVVKWKKQIDKNNMLWHQVLDENGAVSKKFNITKFPTNFLLDENGKILKRDVSKIELLSILSKL